MISQEEAMEIVSMSIPDEGISVREFYTRAVNLCGLSKRTVDYAILLWENGGGSEEDIILPGSNRTKLN